jgi:hypothetical protein
MGETAGPVTSAPTSPSSSFGRSTAPLIVDDALLQMLRGGWHERTRPVTSASERAKRLKPLGYQRLRVLRSLGGDMSHLPQYFDPPPDADLLAAFRDFVHEMARRCESESDPVTRSLVGAGMLLTGDLSGASAIIEHLPAQPVKLDHGAGYALVVPVQVLRTALPWPEALQDRSRWLAGSAEQAALRDWLEQHRNQLRWHEAQAEYRVESEGTS